ncbi:MAG: 3-hexulose-6-phosphate synthase [Anaerolineae bacterium]
MTTRLQLALDGTLERSLQVLAAARPYIDIAELGTPLIYREGISAAKQVRALYPDLTILADFKIMDAGEEEAAIAFEAGCNLVTVLAVTQDATMQGALRSAQKYGKALVADLMGVSDLVGRARDLQAMGCQYLAVHLAHDLQGAAASPVEPLQQLRQQLPQAALAVAGGIKLPMLDDVLQLGPEIVIVGSAIAGSNDPAAAAREFHERIVAHDQRA